MLKVWYPAQVENENLEIVESSIEPIIDNINKKVEFLENNKISYWFPNRATKNNNIIQPQLSITN